MENTNPPCKECVDRHCGCHSECDKYKEYNESRKAELEERKKAREIDRGIAEHFMKFDRRVKHNKTKSKIIRSRKR